MSGQGEEHGAASGREVQLVVFEQQSVEEDHLPSRLSTWRAQNQEKTQKQLAEEIGIAQSALSVFCKPGAPLRGKTREKIERFLSTQELPTTAVEQPSQTAIPNTNPGESVPSDADVLPPPALKPLEPRGPSSEQDRQEFYIPVHGFVWFYPEEVEIIDHPAFQRLQGIHQLGLAYAVFRGANHTRFEHVLGTVKVVERMLDAITHNCRKSSHENLEGVGKYVLGAEPSSLERRLVRLAALLHDIGHLPFGHSIEDELHLLNKHDNESRLRKVLFSQEWNGYRSNSLAEIINTYYKGYLDEVGLSQFSPVELLLSIVLKTPAKQALSEAEMVPAIDEEVRRGTKLHEAFLNFVARSKLRIDLCRDIVANTICADLLDYLHRDWYHIGKPQYFEDRIIQYMEIRAKREFSPLSVHSTGNLIDQAYSSDDKLVINIGSRPRLRTDGISAILALLESRYHLAETVLFHRTKLKATGMLERLLNLGFRKDTVGAVRYKDWEERGEGWNTDLEAWLLSVPESAVLPLMSQGAALVPMVQDSDRRIASSRLSVRILQRRLYDEVLVATFDQHGWQDVVEVQNIFGDSDEGPQNREKTVRLLEEDFGLPLGSVAMYCPESRMNKKIAKVKIYVDRNVYTFEEYETNDRLRRKLSFGHLNAQLSRFTNLWRIGFYIDPEVWESRSQEFRAVFTKFIEVGILQIVAETATYEAELSAVVSRALELPELRRLASERGRPHAAARNARDSVRGTYPNGTRSILASWSSP